VKDGQSEAHVECHAELVFRESGAAGGKNCLKQCGGAGAGHTAESRLCDLSVGSTVVQT
jgi:hypothetical protein